MKITAIKPQVHNDQRYSISIDGDYSFSLDAASLLTEHIVVGQELTTERIEQLQSMSLRSIWEQQALRYCAKRLHSVGQVDRYLKSKGCPAQETEQITNKLLSIGILSDQAFAAAYIHDHTSVKPTSRRKITAALQQLRVSPEVISAAFAAQDRDDNTSLQALIKQKRRQLKYQDNEVLRRYLYRQGFHSDAIAAALDSSS